MGKTMTVERSAMIGAAPQRVDDVIDDFQKGLAEPARPAES